MYPQDNKFLTSDYVGLVIGKASLLKIKNH